MSYVRMPLMSSPPLRFLEFALIALVSVFDLDFIRFTLTTTILLIIPSLVFWSILPLRISINITSAKILYGPCGGGAPGSAFLWPERDMQIARTRAIILYRMRKRNEEMLNRYVLRLYGMK
jgi:hypothetical protein